MIEVITNIPEHYIKDYVTDHFDFDDIAESYNKNDYEIFILETQDFARMIYKDFLHEYFDFPFDWDIDTQSTVEIYDIIYDTVFEESKSLAADMLCM